MTRTLLESIQEAAAFILSNVETMCDEEIADILSHDELQEIDTALWEMVEMTQ
jgi:hypothetical protein